ncbi:MAG TPA: hypothetical protein VMW22_06800 [Candidatus Desulfaltia sp.]|nr:hypothetical protein [Candidatus Desulfaltia sp.]
MIHLTLDRDKRPSITDYMAGAVLSYGIVYFWIELKTFYDPPWVLAYIMYYLASLIPSYLVCKRTGAAELPVAIRSVLISWALVIVNLWAFTQGNTTSLFALLLVMFLLGGATSAYISLRRRLKPAKQGATGPGEDTNLNQP